MGVAWTEGAGLSTSEAWSMCEWAGLVPVRGRSLTWPRPQALRWHFRWAAPGAELCLWLPQLDLRPPPARRPWYSPAMRPERLRLLVGGVRGAAGRGGGRLQCETLSGEMGRGLWGGGGVEPSLHVVGGAMGRGVEGTPLPI